MHWCRMARGGKNWYQVPWALAGSGYRTPSFKRAPHPASPRDPPSGPSVFLWGQLETYQPPPPQFLSAQPSVSWLCEALTPQSEARLVPQTHPWFSKHQPTAAPAQNGQGRAGLGFRGGWGGGDGKGLRSNQLIADMSTSELKTPFQTM